MYPSDYTVEFSYTDEDGAESTPIIVEFTIVGKQMLDVNVLDFTDNRYENVLIYEFDQNEYDFFQQTCENNEVMEIVDYDIFDVSMDVKSQHAYYCSIFDENDVTEINN